jgi:hypothetical protein
MQRSCRSLLWHGRHRSRVQPWTSWPRRRSIRDLLVSHHGGKARRLAYLIRGVASQATDGRLNSSSSRVDIRLKSGSVLVRHDCVCFVLFRCVVWLIDLGST